MTYVQRGAVSAPLAVGGILVILLILGGWYYMARQTDMLQTEDVMMEESEDAMMQEDDAMMEAEEEVMERMPSGANYSGQVLAGSRAPLLEFNQADYDKAMADGSLVVLYFYANWCPTCKAEFPMAEAAFDQLTTSGVVGFRVNFNDNETSAEETALAREFGVPYQHTKVFVRMGEQLLKSPEAWTTQRYVDEIMSHL